MKVGLVGFGYWGKIIFNNLIQLGLDVVICDLLVEDDKVKYTDFKDLLSENIKHVFVVTQVSKHYECVEFFLNNGVNVFCEKPLTLDLESSENLYQIAQKNNVNLFVDWIFTFNKAINYIKYLIQNLELRPKNILMNRLNSGPSRFDTDSKFDLSSHDLSIVSYLFPDYNPKDKRILDFKRNFNSLQNDSSVIFLNYGDFNVQINSSWEYGHKDRNCVFEFDRGIIVWDDNSRGLDIRFDINDLTKYNFYIDDNLIYDSPLKDSINSFINNKNFNYILQKEVTLNVLKNLI